MTCESICTFFTFFYVFFKIQKNMTFYVFLSCCTRFPEQCAVAYCLAYNVVRVNIYLSIYSIYTARPRLQTHRQDRYQYSCAVKVSEHSQYNEIQVMRMRQPQSIADIDNVYAPIPTPYNTLSLCLILTAHCVHTRYNSVYTKKQDDLACRLVW